MKTRTELSPDEVSALGEEWYEKLKSRVEPNDLGRFLVVNVKTGEFAVGDDYIQPTEGLLREDPEAELYALRIGYRAIGRIGGRFTPPLRATPASC